MDNDNLKTKRITDTLINEWKIARNGKKFPSIDDINKKNLQKVFDDCFILKVIPLVLEVGFSFEYIGKNLSEEFHKDAAGKYIKNLVIGFMETTTDKYKKVVASEEILMEEGVYQKDNHILKYRQILLPISNNKDDKIDHILGGMRFRTESIDSNKWL